MKQEIRFSGFGYIEPIGIITLHVKEGFRKPRLREIIIDSVTEIEYMVTDSLSDGSIVRIRPLSKDNIARINPQDFLNNTFVPYHLHGVPESSKYSEAPKRQLSNSDWACIIVGLTWVLWFIIKHLVL